MSVVNNVTGLTTPAFVNFFFQAVEEKGPHINEWFSRYGHNLVTAMVTDLVVLQRDRQSILTIVSGAVLELGDACSRYSAFCAAGNEIGMQSSLSSILSMLIEINSIVQNASAAANESRNQRQI
ncbi:MAG: hypothetical protein LBI34_00440 [Puniceicoccales bacterium]|nr:hypothetical protein [Puniceicoccales bacterium]